MVKISIAMALIAIIIMMFVAHDIIFGVVTPTTHYFILEAMGMTILSAIYYYLR